jgi:hypothetical protein
MLDCHGVVTSRVFEEAYQERDTVSSILVRLGQHVDMPATTIAGAHLSVTTYAADRVAAQGTHFSIVVDVIPAARVHVYAPGASSYIPVALRIHQQPGVVVRRAIFPKSDDYFFQPLKDPVPVYQRPFRVIQDLMLDPSRDGTAALKDVPMLTITGSFDYQACDDKVCFPPQSVPLSWTIEVKLLDRERAK